MSMGMRAPVASLGSGTMTTGSVGMPIMANGVPPMGGQPGFVGKCYHGKLKFKLHVLHFLLDYICNNVT